MNFYEITYIIDDRQQEKLSALAERYQKVNGWNEKEILQFAVTANSESDIETKLQFLENEAAKLEKEWREQEEQPKEKRKYISDEEREKCRQVVAAFTELFEQDDVLVLEAGKYGFVKLQYYKLPFGFDEVTTFTDSRSLFEDLWEEWFDTQLILLSRGTPMAEMDYKDIFKCLPKEKKKELMEKKKYFAEKAGIVRAKDDNNNQK